MERKNAKYPQNLAARKGAVIEKHTALWFSSFDDPKKSIAKEEFKVATELGCKKAHVACGMWKPNTVFYLVL